MIDIQIGNAFNLIKLIPDKSIDCIVTSPPYWGLRDYKTPPVIFDEITHCKHEWIENTYIRNNDKPVENAFCSKCNAWKGHLGLEPTPELYLKHILNFFYNTKPKLKDTGNLFVNLGDTYWGGGNASGHTKNTVQFNTSHTIEKGYVTKPVAKGKHPFYQSKSLCMIPSRFALGMIERGWILRNEIIFHKNNHMPESVKTRLTKAHEMIYHFVTQEKYYYDLNAIREPCVAQENRSMGIIRSRDWGYKGKYKGNELCEDFGSPRARTQRNKQNSNIGKKHSHEKGKNPGDVWTINTQAYSGAHFAVFPIELVRRPILAGCPPEGHVLDPFGGSGTVAQFCIENNRNCIILELNPDYKPLIQKRSRQDTIPLLSLFTKQSDSP